MFKKYMKKVLAFSLATALAFSGAQIVGAGGADVASAAASGTVIVTTNPDGGANPAEDISISGVEAAQDAVTGITCLNAVGDDVWADTADDAKIALKGTDVNIAAGEITIAKAKFTVGKSIAAGNYTLTIATEQTADSTNTDTITISVVVKAAAADTFSFETGDITLSSVGTPSKPKSFTGLQAIKGTETKNISAKAYYSEATTGIVHSANDAVDAVEGLSLNFSNTTAAGDSTFTVSATLGKTLPGKYKVYVNTGDTTASKAVGNYKACFFVTVPDASNDTLLNLGLGETANVFYETANSKTSADDKTALLKASKSDANILGNITALTSANLKGYYATSSNKLTVGAKTYLKLVLTGGATGDKDNKITLTTNTYASESDSQVTEKTLDVKTETKASVDGIEDFTLVAGKSADMSEKFTVKVTQKNGAPDTAVYTVKDDGASGTILEVAGTVVTAKPGVEGTAYLEVTGSSDTSAKKTVAVRVVNPTLTVKDADNNTLCTAKSGAEAKNNLKQITLDLIKNTSKQVFATATEGAKITYSVETEKYVKVSEDGTVTAVKATPDEGVPVTVSATYDGVILSTSFNAIVKEKPENSLTVKDDKGEKLTNVTTDKLSADKKEWVASVKGINLDLTTNTATKLDVTAETATRLTFSGAAAGTTTSAPFTVDEYTGEIKVKDKATGIGYVVIHADSTATTETTTYKVAVTVTAKPLDTITTNADDVKVIVGQTAEIGAKSAAGASLTYTLSVVKEDGTAGTANATDFASIDATGVITGKKATSLLPDGESLIVTVKAAATDTTDVTKKIIGVTVAATGDNVISIINKDTNEVVGDTIDIDDVTNLSISAKDNAEIEATSLNPEFISIAQSGDAWVLTPNTSGAAVIKIVAKEVKDKYSETTRYLVVNYGKSMATITADKSITVNVGDTATIDAVADDGSTLSFSSDDETIATVNESGVVTGVKAGTTFVLIKAPDGALAVTTVKVVKKTNTLTVKAKTAKIKPNKKVTLKRSKVLTVSKAKGTVTYTKKSGSKLITINSSTGKVTIKKGLKAGKTYKVKVAVKAAGNDTYKAKTVTKTFKIKVKKK